MSMQHNEGSTKSVKSSVESQFSRVAANYAASSVHRQGPEFQKMLDMAALTGTERVLDAGCGPGHTALTFAPHVGHVTAIDLSKEMLGQGRQLADEQGITNVEFKTGDVEELRLDNDAFDLIVTRFSAHHWPAPLKALAEFRRVLRTERDVNGQLLIADVVSFEDFTIDTHQQAIELLRDSSHVRDHTTGQWLSMLETAGFKPSVSYEWSLRLDFDSWVERMQTPADTVTTIRTLIQNAPDEVREALQVEPNDSFSLRCALLSAVPIP